MEVFKETFEFGIQLTYLHPLDTAALALHSLSTPDSPLTLTAPTRSITKWWCWYFDDQFMSGWAGPCVWTHFHRFLLKTVQSFQSNEDGAKIMGSLLFIKKKKGKKEKETETGALCFREEMYQKAFCPSPPRTTTSARLAAKSTNYWLVVGENGAWQQLPRWPGLCVNTKIPLLLLILLPPYFLTPPAPPSAPFLPLKQRIAARNRQRMCVRVCRFSPWSASVSAVTLHSEAAPTLVINKHPDH